jgi:DNA gyrase subunit A
MAYVFKHTGLQINFNVNLTALVPTATPGVGQPARLTLRDLCRHFLDFRLEVVTRRLEHELRELRERLHILAGFLKLFSNVDRAIKIIRQSASRADAAKQLMKDFRLDEIQTDAILETRLYQLARLEIEKIREEQREKQKRALEIEALLKNKKARWKVVETELQEVAQRHGDKRRTVLSAGAELVYDAEAYVVHEDTTVVVTRDGWMKRLGEVKDPGSTRVREGDLARWILRGNTRDNLALFSNFGFVYVMKVANVPATTGYGEPVQSLLNFKDGERVIAAALVTPTGEVESPPTAAPRWLVATARGMGFFCRPDLSETTKNGRRLARTKEGDEVLVVASTEGDTITAATAGSKVLAFPAEELPELSGVGSGVILMRVDKGDRLVGAVCHPVDQPPIAIAEDGSERRFHLPEIAHRAQKGRKALKRFKPAELVTRNAPIEER